MPDRLLCCLIALMIHFSLDRCFFSIVSYCIQLANYAYGLYPINAWISLKFFKRIYKNSISLHFNKLLWNILLSSSTYALSQYNCSIDIPLKYAHYGTIHNRILSLHSINDQVRQHVFSMAVLYQLSSILLYFYF